MKLISIISTIVLLELILAIFYSLITPKEKKQNPIDFKAIIKGLVERAFLTYAFLNNFPHALTLFGALKLGTRLKSADNETTEEGKKSENKYNDYYLVGNFVSVCLSMVYYNLLK